MVEPNRPISIEINGRTVMVSLKIFSNDKKNGLSMALTIVSKWIWDLKKVYKIHPRKYYSMVYMKNQNKSSSKMKIAFTFCISSELVLNYAFVWSSLFT